MKGPSAAKIASIGDNSRAITAPPTSGRTIPATESGSRGGGSGGCAGTTIGAGSTAGRSRGGRLNGTTPPTSPIPACTASDDISTRATPSADDAARAVVFAGTTGGVGLGWTSDPWRRASWSMGVAGGCHHPSTMTPRGRAIVATCVVGSRARARSSAERSSPLITTSTSRSRWSTIRSPRTIQF